MGLHPDYPIVTERLLLRPLHPDDVDAVHAYQSLPDVVRYVPYQPRTREQVLDMLTTRSSTTGLDAPGFLPLVIALREDGTVIGDVVLMWHSEEHKAGEIGYILNPAYAGRGYVTEAARALLRLAFDGLGLHRVVAHIDARNLASTAVARRLGMRQEAHLRENEWFKGEWSDSLIFALLEDEWRAATGTMTA